MNSTFLIQWKSVRFQSVLKKNANLDIGPWIYPADKYIPVKPVLQVSS